MHTYILTLLLLIYILSSNIVSALWRRAWVGSLSGDPFWKEGDAFPTSNEQVNRFLTYTEVAYNVVLNTVGHVPAWNDNEIMFGVVESDYADLRGLKGACLYGDAYFTIDNYGGYGTVFCDGMATAFWVGHEWGHGYWLQAGLTNEKLEAVTIAEFLSDVLGFTVQTLASPQYPDTPRTACSQYGTNPGFAYVEGTGGLDDSKRWIVGVNCTGTSVICPTRDMWDPTCFGAADRIGSELFLCGDGSNEPSGRAKRSHMNNGPLNKFFSLLVDGGSFNGQDIAPLGLDKSVRIVLEAILPSDGTQRPPNMTFRDLATYLETACNDAIATELKDTRTGEVLNDSIVANDCNQVASAIAAVEMTQEPNCSGVLSPPMTSSAVCGEYLTTMALEMLLLVAATCLL